MSSGSEHNLAMGAVLQEEPYELRKAHDRLRNLDVELRALPQCSKEEGESVKDSVRRLMELGDEEPRLGKVYGAVRANGRACVEQEAPGGGTLVKYVLDYGLKLKVALNMAANIARGLDALHRRDIFHGNLHPRSIRIGQDGKLRLMDLGGPPPRPDASTTPWMRRYVAPERALGGPWSKACDVYVLGTILFELLAPTQVQESVLGGDPSDDGVWYAFHRDRKQQFPGLHQFLAPLPKPLSDLIQSMTHKDADRRPTAEEAFRGFAGKLAPAKEGGARGEGLELAPEFESASGVAPAPAAPVRPARAESTGGFHFDGIAIEGGAERAPPPEPTRGEWNLPSGDPPARRFLRLYRLPLILSGSLVLLVAVFLVLKGGGSGPDPVAEELGRAKPVLSDRRPEGARFPDTLPSMLVARTDKETNEQGFYVYRHRNYPEVEFVYVPLVAGRGMFISVGEIPRSVGGSSDADPALPAAAGTVEEAEKICERLGDGFHVAHAYHWLVAAGIYEFQGEFVPAEKAPAANLLAGTAPVPAAGAPDGADTSYCGVRNLQGNVAEWVLVGSAGGALLLGGYPGVPPDRAPLTVLQKRIQDVPPEYRGVRAVYFVAGSGK